MMSELSMIFASFKHLFKLLSYFNIECYTTKSDLGSGEYAACIIIEQGSQYENAWVISLARKLGLSATYTRAGWCIYFTYEKLGYDIYIAMARYLAEGKYTEAAKLKHKHTSTNTVSINIDTKLYCSDSNDYSSSDGHSHKSCTCPSCCKDSNGRYNGDGRWDDQ